MISINHKAKQFLLVIIKLLIVTAALYYIYRQLQGDKSLQWQIISTYLSVKYIFILLGFSILNWVFEILKWKHLVSSFKEISFFEAMKQSLGSLTASIFTPNRIGEYGAKMLYYPKENSKQIVLLNFIGNSSQMLVTTFFGVFGFIISKKQFQISIIYYLAVIIILIGLTFFLRNIESYGFSIQKLVSKLTKFPKNIMLTNFQLAALRYFVFSHQFYFLLVFFNCEISYPLALSTIFLMYLLASIVPTIHLMDVAIKGSVAVYLFGQMGIENWKIIAITSLMWIFNLVLPVLVGSYFVLRFKPQKL